MENAFEEVTPGYGVINFDKTRAGGYSFSLKGCKIGNTPIPDGTYDTWSDVLAAAGIDQEEEEA